MASFEIVNIVGTIDFHREFNLDSLASEFQNRDEIADVKFDPSKHHWLQTWFKPEDTYVAFYRRGTCSLTGCNSVKGFDNIGNRVCAVMADILGAVNEPDIQIRNMVVTYDTQSPISLETLSLELGLESIEYEPEQFPGLVYRGSNYVILVFASGKLLCTGLTDLETIAETVDEFVGRIPRESKAQGRGQEGK